VNLGSPRLPLRSWGGTQIKWKSSGESWARVEGEGHLYKRGGQLKGVEFVPTNEICWGEGLGQGVRRPCQGEKLPGLMAFVPQLCKSLGNATRKKREGEKVSKGPIKSMGP